MYQILTQSNMSEPQNDRYYDNFFNNVANSRNGSLAHYYDNMYYNKIPIEHYKKYKTIMTEYYENTMFHNILYNLSRWQLYLKIKNEITNFKICLSDNTEIYCLKEALYIIPYFKILFNDCNGNEITLDTDPTITKSIIDSLYFGNLKDSLTITNIIDTFKILDKFMFYDAIHDVLQFIYQHHKTIIKTMLDNDFNDIFILKMLLDNVMNDDFKDVNYNPYGIKPIKKLTNDVIRSIFYIVGNHLNDNYDDKKNIFMFDGWPKCFNIDAKLRAITQSKKYELLNVCDIDPIIIVKFLIEENPELDCYTDICTFWPQIYFNESITEHINHYNNYAIITNYYPKFEYITLSKYNYPFNFYDNKIKISSSSVTPYIKFDTKILLCQNDINYFEFNIIGFNKCVNGKTVPTKEITKFAGLFLSIKYEIILNKPPTYPLPKDYHLYFVNTYSF